MRSFLYSFIFILFFIPAFVFAADSGFAPGSSLTFSKGNFFTGDLVKIYAIVVNNKYEKLSGTLGFYANTDKIGSTNFGPLNFEQAAQVSRDWVPTYGDITMRAEFTNLVAVKDDGATTTLGEPGFEIGGYVEIQYFVDRDTDKDSVGDRLDTDDDNDTLTDDQEKEYGTSPVLADTDNDGLNDRFELDRNYDPLKTDTDGDGVPDGKDAFPLDSHEQTDSNKNGVGDNADKEAAFKAAPPETAAPKPVPKTAPEKQKPAAQPAAPPPTLTPAVPIPAAEPPTASGQPQETDVMPRESPAPARTEPPGVSELQTAELLVLADNRLNNIKKVVLIAGLISLAITFVSGALWLKTRSH